MYKRQGRRLDSVSGSANRALVQAGGSVCLEKFLNDMLGLGVVAQMCIRDSYDSGAAVPRDQARLAVDEIEVKLRRVLHDILRSHLGEDYWKSAVPGDLQAKIKERISERNRSKIVARIEDPLIRLQYCLLYTSRCV